MIPKLYLGLAMRLSILSINFFFLARLKCRLGKICDLFKEAPQWGYFERFHIILNFSSPVESK